jgi:hypothetical protein
MSKLFQITEEDLAELEHVMPQIQNDLFDELAGPAGNRIRVQLRRVKEILTNVRWDYGPPEHVERIDAGDAGPAE